MKRDEEVRAEERERCARMVVCGAGNDPCEDCEEIRDAIRVRPTPPASA